MSDVDSSPRFGHICLQLSSDFFAGGTCEGIFLSVNSPVGKREDNQMRLLPCPDFFFSFLTVISPRIIIWKSTPQLSHFPGIWLCGRETLDGAGLVGLWKARAGECIYSPLPPKCHLSCSWQTNAAPEETSEGLLTNTTAIITSRSSGSVNKSLTCPNISI